MSAGGFGSTVIGQIRAMMIARTIRIVALLVVVAGVLAAPLDASAAPRRIDPGTLRTMVALRHTTAEDASRHGDVTCFVASTRAAEDRPARIAFTCDRLLRAPRIVSLAGHAETSSVATTADSALVAGCTRRLPDRGVDTPLLMRLRHDGSTVTEFGVDGRAAIRAVPGHPHACVTKVDVLDDGRIVLVGVASASPTAKVDITWFARLLADGTPDPSFGVDGVATVAVWQATETFPYDLRGMADGRLLAVGHARFARTGRRPLAVLLREDGYREQGFAQSGILVRGGMAGQAWFGSIARREGDARPSFPIEVSGSWNLQGDVRPSMVRITEAGSVQQGWGLGYDRRLPVTMYGAPDDLQAIPAIVERGRVVLAAERPSPYWFAPWVTKLDSSGRLPLSRRFRGAEPIDPRPGVKESTEFVVSLVPGPGRPVVFGSAFVGGRWVAERFTASAPAPAPARAARLRAGSPASIRTCGSSRRTACRVPASRAASFVGLVEPALGPAAHPPLSRMTVEFHRLVPDGISGTSEHRMSLVSRNGWKWVLSRRLARGQYVATMHRSAGPRVGVVETAPLWVTVT